jgi:hypothetical protein
MRGRTSVTINMVDRDAFVAAITLHERGQTVIRKLEEIAKPRPF